MSQFSDIITANKSYAREFTLQGLTPPAAKGLGVLTCIDSRIEPLAMMGLQAGDAKILRNAGARVTNDALRSLVVAAHLLNVSRIMVVAHTDCAMAGTTDDKLKAELHRRDPEAPMADYDLHAMPDQLAALQSDVRRLRDCPQMPVDVVIAGFEYDVHTGLLREVIAV